MTKLRPTFWQRLKKMLGSSSTPNDNSTENTANSSEISATSLEPTKANNPVNFAFADDIVDMHNQINKEVWDLTKEVHHSEHDLPAKPVILANDIEQLLEQLGYTFIYHPVSELDEQQVHHFTMQVSDNEHEWGCMIRYFAEQQLIAVYSVFPFSVPDTHRGEMLVMMSHLNYDMVIGNLEMDLDDGELRFKTSLDLEVTGANELVLSYLLQSNFSLTSRLYEVLEDVIKQANPQNDLHKVVTNLLLKQQENKFYLMSEKVQ